MPDGAENTGGAARREEVLRLTNPLPPGKAEDPAAKPAPPAKGKHGGNRQGGRPGGQGPRKAESPGAGKGPAKPAARGNPGPGPGKARPGGAGPATARDTSPPGETLGAPPARPRGRHLVAAALFCLIVLAPTVLTAAYLWFVAADRYASATAFSVRSNETTAPLEILGTVTQLGNSSAVLDGQILYDFIRSQRIVELVERELPLRAIWNHAPDDWWFSLGPERSVEDLTEHWNDAVDVSLDPASGILTVEARAFRPDEATAIAQAILDNSAALVNQLTEAARTDAVAHAEFELAEAEARLRDIRSRLRVFRDFEQEVDPSENARVAVGLVAGLEQELSEAQTSLDLLAATLSPTSPRIQLLKRRISTLEDRIAEERTRLGTGVQGEGGDARPLAAVVGDFEELLVDREFAEQAYTLALSTLEQAQAEARRRHRYLAAHVPPTLSEEAAYPDRPLLTGAVFGIALSVWAVLMMIGWNIRDRR